MPDFKGDVANLVSMRSRHATSADYQACADLLRQGSKSFHLASKVLPQRVREPASALYAFCRVADDAVDLEKGGDATLSALAERLDRVYAGCPGNDPVERALADVVLAFAIPRELLDALIEGLAWDDAGQRYQDISDLRAYSARVASTVGVITTLIMGERNPKVLARAADLGVAMQLTNISRDVGEDARAGRLYLPENWMHEAGLNPDAWLRQPVFDHRLAGVVRRLLAHADELYRRSIPGIGDLPRDCRTGIHAARLIYAEIGHEVERQGFDSISRRAVVSTKRKLWLLMAAFRASMAGRAALGDREADLPPLSETEFLIEAVRSHPVDYIGQQSAPNIAWWDVGHRMVWTVELFTRLAMEERLQRSRH